MLRRRSSQELRVSLRGGLANQLFQWAVARHLQREFGCDLTFDARVISRGNDRGLQLDPLGLSPSVIEQGRTSELFWRTAASRLSERVYAHLNANTKLNWSFRTTTDYECARTLLRRGADVEMAGYFEEIDLVVATMDELRPVLMDGLRSASTVDAPADDYAVVHVRRGDYVRNPHIARLFGPCSSNYYARGIELLEAPLVYVTSDDPDWVRSTLQPRVDKELLISKGQSHYDDLLLIASARAVVMSNSTFSWWGAMLSAADQVVCPSPWNAADRQDFFRPGWRLLDKAEGADLSNAR